MKTGKFAMTAAALLLCSAVQADPWPAPAQSPASAPAAPAASSANESAAQKTSADAAKIASLQSGKAELIRKIAKKRTELLKNDPKLHRMYIQLLKQTRALALELDSNREMRELNDALSEIEKEIKKLSDK